MLHPSKNYEYINLNNLHFQIFSINFYKNEILLGQLSHDH